MYRTLLSLLVLLAMTAPALAGEARPVVPTPRDHCPVCGMFTAPFPDFLSQIIYADGSYLTFDGPKDLFKFRSAPARYLPVPAQAQIQAVFVKDYYTLEPIDAGDAWFVLGSDVFGPMGKELIPFAREADAREFLADHHGRRILRFEEVTPAILKELD